MGSDFPSNRTIEEIEITDQVKNLMPNEFIRKTEFGVDYFSIVKEDKVMEATSSSQPHSFKHLYILEKAKCPRRGDQIPESLFALQGEIKNLLSNRGRIV